MAEDLRGRLEILREIEQAEVRIQRARQSTVLTQEKINKYVEEQKQRVVELGKEVKELNQKRLDSLAAEERGLGSLGSMYNRLTDLERERITSMAGMSNMLPAQQEAISKIAEINSSIAQLGRDDVVQRVALTEQYNQQLDVLNSIGGVQQEILDNLIAQNEVANQYANLSTKQKDFLQKQLDVYDGIKDTIGGILETADLLVSTTGGKLGAALIGAGFAADKLGESVRSMGGFIGGAQLSSIGLGMVFENAEETTKSLAKEFGGLNDISFQTQLNTNLIATNMGIGQSEAAALLGNFSRLNGGSMETAENLAESTKQLAKQNGLVPSQVMADVAGSAKAFAEYGKDGGKNIAMAAVSAAKLGVNMDTLTNITDSLLDFETSINNELELGAMLGRNINLNRARALAYEGKIGASVKETLRELGGVEAFNRMDIFQKRQAAQTLGISVEELGKMANNLDKLNDDGTFQLSTFDSWTQSLSAFASGPLGSSLKGMGSLVIAAGQFNNGLGSMGTSLGKIGGKIQGMVSSFLGLGKTATTATQSIAGVAGGAGGVGQTVQRAGDVAQTPGPSKGVGEGLKSLASGLRAMGNTKVLLGALYLIPSALGLVAMLPAIPVLALLGLVGPSAQVGLTALGKGLTSFGNAVSKALPQIGIGLLVLAGLGAALIPLTYALSLLSPVIEAFGNVIRGVFSGVAEVVTSVANGFVTLMNSVSPEKVAGLFMLGPALISAAAGLGVFALALGSAAVGSFFGGGLLGDIGTLAEMAEPLSQTAMALTGIGAGIMSISTALTGIDAAKLDAIEDFSVTAAAMGAVQQIGASVTGVIEGIAGLFGGEGKKEEEDKQQILIDEIKGLRTDLNTGKIAVYMDGERVTSRVSKVVDRIGSNSYAVK
jgi:hypothetical protein